MMPPNTLPERESDRPVSLPEQSTPSGLPERSSPPPGQGAAWWILLLLVLVLLGMGAGAYWFLLHGTAPSTDATTGLNPSSLPNTAILSKSTYTLSDPAVSAPTRLAIQVYSHRITAVPAKTSVDICALIPRAETEKLLGALADEPKPFGNSGPTIKGSCQWETAPGEGEYVGNSLSVTIYTPFLVPADKYFEQLTQPLSTLHPIPVSGLGKKALYMGDPERTSQLFVLGEGIVVHSIAGGIEASTLETFVKLILDRLP